MIWLQNVGKSFGERVLLKNATLMIDKNDRIGLVGANGAGKSTLLALIMGREVADSGQVHVAKGVTFGYLPQEVIPVEQRTVLQEALLVSAERDHLLAERRRIEGQLADLSRSDERAQKQLLRQYGDIQHRLDLIASDDLEPRAKAILAGLGFHTNDFDRPLSQFSGGWVMRAVLARLLVSRPDFLLLDEPTNHLDLEALGWFQDYLRSYAGGLLVVSHDREFLNSTVTSIVELRHGQLTRYAGNYEDYVRQRDARLELLESAQKNQQRKIAQVERFIERFRAKATKARQVQSRIKMLQKIERIELPDLEPTVHFHFPQPEKSGKIVVELVNVHKSYGAKRVYEDLTLQLERGEKIALVGPNGAGKSTLLKLMAGVVPFERGERRLGRDVRCAYYTQFRHEMLDLNKTVLEEAMSTTRNHPEVYVRTVLGAFLFHGDDVFKPVSVLSGGEKSRLALVKILLDPPNLLLMDEPTIHLDLDSIDALIEALNQFTGTLVMISHDVFFIRHVAEKIIRVEQGRLTVYPGDYDYYQWRRSQETSSPQATVAEPAESATNRHARQEQKRREAQQRNEQYRRQKQLRDELAEVEQQLAKMQHRHEELSNLLQSPDTYKNGANVAELTRQFSLIEATIEQLNQRWEELALQFEAMQANNTGD
ncbi:MAG: ABC-F family ATP-binding cassette domain-containing protein [Acidobacteriota bacterium]|nr:ABC-F family ATP-binding cassette domain-containing protein [Blastocatellia bacterium]MDW8239692.1 ABC-F family ATP-binding cassette domain-containing protein [Acidobacteriota bacterium]